MKTEIASILGFLLVFLFSVLTWSFARRSIASSTERVIWRTLSTVGGLLLLLACVGELIMFSGQLQAYMFSYIVDLSPFEVTKAVLAYLLASVVPIMFLKQIKLVWLKATLVTLYFCVTLFTFILLNTLVFSLLAGNAAEDLRRSSVATAEDVRILTLLQKSNAQEINSNQYHHVTHNLENEIDNLLPVANNYLFNKSSLCWRLQDLWFGDMMENCFPRDLPSVVRYRKTHPPVWNHGSYDLVMTRYSQETDMSKLYCPNFDETNAQPTSAGDSSTRADTGLGAPKK